jgi:hypothetical protein
MVLQLKLKGVPSEIELIARILTFGLLGPLLGYLVFLTLSGDHAALVGRTVGLVMPLVFAIESLPFLICAVVDFFLENVRWWERVAISFLLGFLLTFFAVFALLPTAAITDWRLLPLGLVGAIPASVCSWLVASRVCFNRAEVCR